MFSIVFMCVDTKCYYSLAYGGLSLSGVLHYLFY